MKLGLIARGDLTGLGTLTRSYYKHLKPHRTMVVDLSRHSGQKPDLSFFGPEAYIWDDGTYPDTTAVKDPLIEEFLDSVDVVFTCETPYNYWLFERAREKGVKTVLQLMFEFLDYSIDSNLPMPDLFLAPSMWHWDDLKSQLGDLVSYAPVPVDRELFPFKRRTFLDKVLHTAGTAAQPDRNGTLIAIEAMKYVKSPVRMTLRSQANLRAKTPANVDHIVGRPRDASSLYSDEDVFLMPRRFGGLCLPIKEALSCGMPVLMPACDPQTTWLPEPLTFSAKPVDTLQTRNKLTLYDSDPVEIASKIDWLVGSPNDVIYYSDWADYYSESVSWDKMLKTYQELIKSV